MSRQFLAAIFSKGWRTAGVARRRRVPRKPTQPTVLREPAAGARTTARSLTSIAAAAGVSVSTVSQGLNGRTDVAPATRERIGLLLRQRGYQPGARLGFGVVDLLLGLGKGQPGMPQHDPWTEQLIHGTVTAAAEAGHSVVVTPVDSAEEFDRWLELATVRGTHGALSVVHLPRGTELQRLPAAGRPAAALGSA